MARTGQMAQTSETIRQLKNDPAMYMVIMPNVPIIVDTANNVPRTEW